MILPKTRDPRLMTTRRGGSLTDRDHRLLALWAATCAEHVLDLFEAECPDDPRPRAAIERLHGWVRGEVRRWTRVRPVVALWAVKAVRAASPTGERHAAGRWECRWQRDQLPSEVRELVLEDQARRN